MISRSFVLVTYLGLFEHYGLLWFAYGFSIEWASVFLYWFYKHGFIVLGGNLSAVIIETNAFILRWMWNFVYVYAYKLFYRCVLSKAHAMVKLVFWRTLLWITWIVFLECDIIWSTEFTLMREQHLLDTESPLRFMFRMVFVNIIAYPIFLCVFIFRFLFFSFCPCKECTMSFSM